MTLLQEGIIHVEDLDVKDFIKAIRNIAKMRVSEKLDGSNLWFGLDDEGKLFTTREGKRSSSERFYSEEDYPYFAAYNGPRGVQAVLMKKERDIKTTLQPGDMIEIEVLFGRQPNATTYGIDGKNFIAILRGVEGTPDVKADQLAAILENHEVSVPIHIVDTKDGENLERIPTTQTFRFVGVQKIKPELLQSVDLEKELSALESFLNSKSGIDDLTNFDLISTSLGSITKDKRAEAKIAKEKVLSDIKTKYKAPIKKELLDKFVSKIKPALAANDLTGDEDIGIEGVVLKDPETNEQIKIVDKDSFTTINQFNFAVRNQISGVIKTVDDSAPLEARGGVIGNMKIRIADLLGNKELALSREAKKIFAAAKGETPSATIRNVAKTLNGTDDFNGAKTKVEAIVKSTIEELKTMLNDFKHHKESPDQTYRLKLKNGKVIGLSPEIVKRTLMVFAETKRNLTELLGKIKDTKAFDELVAAIFGKIAKAVHADSEELTESLFEEAGSLLLEKRNYTDKARYASVPDSWTLLNIYTATVLMTVLIYKAEDARGLRLVRDKAHHRLSSWSNEMSALNFWGYPVWRASSPAVAKLVSKKVASDTFKVARKIPAQWARYLHMDLSFGRDVPIDWADHYKTMKQLLQFAPSMPSDRVMGLLYQGFKYDELTYDEKVKYLPKLYFYAQQFVPTSPLITRVRAIQNKLLGGDIDTPLVLTKDQELLKEDGESPATTSGEVAGGTATTAQNIEPVPARVGERQIVKRKRNPNIKFLKFKRPVPKDEK